MRVITAASAAIVLAGCPTEHGPWGGGGGGGGGGARPDGGGSGVEPDAGTFEPDAAPACVVPDTCPVHFTYSAGEATQVELRGDFADDGWENGIPLELEGDEFVAEVELGHRKVVQYKFLIDGEEWVADPDNPNTVDDGYGDVNSVITVDCDDCGYSGTGYDWGDAVMYFVMIDRFADGDPDNNDPVSGVEQAANFQGGDLAGLRDVIESGYFGELGVNALWITAPFDNARGAGAGIGDDPYDYAAYHGYWPRDLQAVDPRVGTYEELAAVIDAAHERDIRVVLDYVMNHVHEESPVYSEHPEWFVPVSDCGVCGQGCSWDGAEGKICWFTDYLPDFDFRDQAALDFSVQNAINWAADLGVDGYRLDAVKHIEKDWIRELRAGLSVELGGEDPFYLVGETFDGRRDILKEYIDPQIMLDGQFDFPLRAELAEVVLMRQRPMSDLAAFLDGNDGFYGPGAIMGTFIGNHDVPRSIHLAEDTPLFGAWDGGKDRAWENQPSLPGYAAPFERLAVAYAVLMTMPGVPLIYYGDEIGMPGAGDPDNRRFMQWKGYSEHQLWLKDQIAGLARARGQHPALRSGQRNTLDTGDDVYVYEMVAPGDKVYVALNRGDSSAAAEGLPAGDYQDLVTGETVSAPVTLEPRQARLLASP